MMNEIDFVMPWVDDSDPVWRKKRAEYSGKKYQEGNEDARYRDWDILKYWFRGVEKFAPWVRYVFFITDDQKPEWLNVNHPKLKWIKHTDYIPEEYLPAFSSHVIEWNMHRIEDLSENFVYFNDDVFVIDKTSPEDFFRGGLPCDRPSLEILHPTDFFSHIIFNNMALLNRNFLLNRSIRLHKKKWMKHQGVKGRIKLMLYGRRSFLSQTEAGHIHISFKKSNFHTLWEKEYDSIHNTCKNRFRSKDDVSLWCVRDWQLLSGEFSPNKPIGRMFSTASMSQNNELIDYLTKQMGKVICLNDSENEIDFEKHKQMIIEAFEKILPEKSSFEL